MQKSVDKINALGEEIGALSNEEMRAWTGILKQKLADGATLDQILPEAFALVREAAERTNGERHYDVQLLGGIALHEGNISEMRTGEGKTLMATLAAYLRSLAGRGVHIVTINDYLAKRDADWMRPVYELLGVSVGVIQSDQPFADKQAAYQADITYGTNHEFGFDYLRDNMSFRLQDRVQKHRYFAIVDEVDSILIDEARTPLIISGPANESTELYQKVNQIIPSLVQQEKVEQQLPSILGGESEEDIGDFYVDEQNRTVDLTDRGHATVERKLKRLGLLPEDESLYATNNLGLVHHVSAALRAHNLFKRNVDYMVRNGQVVIIDEHTGRAMVGRRWSEGLHQAVEAKERVEIKLETQTLASTTYQNYFRLYETLSGMTGTAETEAFEFKQIYGLEVIVIPTHRPMIRDDQHDLLYMSLEEKYQAIVDDINNCRERGQPILVGTASIESSERLSKALKKNEIEHSVLNAKQHQREAEIIAQAGRPSTVTIATNMAGRGTDIVLGGNWRAEIQDAELEESADEAKKIFEEWQKRHDQVIEAGGLHIIGTERHDSRRIDNQLRGRSGRQGDPGSSRFYLSLDDNLLRLFASERMRNMMRSMGMDKGEALEGKMVNNTIEKAQRKIEGRNFDARKNLLEYDDVVNDQRQVIYQQRDELLEVGEMSEIIDGMRQTVVEEIVSNHVPPQSIPEHWDMAGLENTLQAEFALELQLQDQLDAEEVVDEVDLRDRISSKLDEKYLAKREKWEAAQVDVKLLEAQVMLSILDQKWKEHLYSMDHLRQSIHLRAYAQKQPKQEYKRESFFLFQEMLQSIQTSVISTLSRIDIAQSQQRTQDEIRRRRESQRNLQYRSALNAPEPESEVPPAEGNGVRQAARPARAKAQPMRRETPKVGRNDPCPCGSGKKYKRCHGLASQSN